MTTFCDIKLKVSTLVPVFITTTRNVTQTFSNSSEIKTKTEKKLMFLIKVHIRFTRLPSSSLLKQRQMELILDILTTSIGITNESESTIG